MTVTHPKGFRAAGVAAGLKASGDPDVALIVSDGPDFTAAGVFTGNRVKAAAYRARKRAAATTEGRGSGEAT